MIIVLCGESNSLKASLLDFLSQKGFQSPADCHGEFDQDKNYAVDLPVSSEWRQWSNQHAVLVWIAADGQAPPGETRVIAPNLPVRDAELKLGGWMLDEMRRRHRPGWDEYFIKIAQVASMRSNCIKRRVGAVIVRDRRIISTGYNGTPRGTTNCNEGGCPRCNSLASSGTRLEDCLCSHAEENAITQAAYHGTSVRDSTIYTTFAPCLMCSKMIINSGIVDVVFGVDYPLNDVSFHLFQQANVKVRKLTVT